MKKLFLSALAIATLLSCNSTQDDITPDNPIVDVPAEEPVEKVENIISEGRINVPEKYLELNSAANDFAWNVFAEILKEHNTENVVFSPFSMAVDLAMLNNGANGKTSSEVTALLGLDGMSKSSINCYFNVLTEGLTQIDPTVKFVSSNAIWYNQNVTMKSPFINTLKDMYLADTNPADLQTQKTVNDINKWCSEKTFGMIPTLINAPNQLPNIFALLNATYVKAPWTEAFDKLWTYPNVFTTSDGQVTTDFMEAYKKIVYYKDNDMRIGFFDMGKSEKFDLFFALPEDGKTLKSTFSYMKENWKKLSDGKETKSAHVSIPKYEVAFTVELTDCFKNLGCTSMFNASTADFKGIADQGIYIQSALQKAKFIVDEDGAEGAAVSDMGGGSTGGGPTVERPSLILNRPFIFGMREKTTGVILFLGVVNNPKAG
ncbi:MAG: hypothetical protein MJZ29_07870 [Bacteroidaceae bacterium]|nr:hypothetical protein [Bacteroidaceae bacterium]